MRVIESVTIRYFRSVYTLNISNCKDFTVITGKNDVGKSNILKALNLFFCKQSDYMKSFDFSEDYSLLRKEEVRKDTIRGQQFISISIKFLRGDRMLNSLPPSFSVTRRWDMHSSEYKQTTDVFARMESYAQKNEIKYSEKTTSTSLSAFLNKIKFIYIPAIKDSRVFTGALNWLQQSLFDNKNKRILDAPINSANEAVQEIVGVLQNDFKRATGIDNFVELPNTLNYASGLLQINTSTKGGRVAIDKRGDGIRTHYIPKILDYVAKHSKNIFIWGFEEPENSYEYIRCMQVAEEFDNNYSKTSQIFITSHSPAFFNNISDNKVIVNIGADGNKTIKLEDTLHLDEELGYIKIYQHFIEQIKELEKIKQEQSENILKLATELKQSHSPLILTEGKTDANLLQLAIKKLLMTDYENWDIRPVLSDKTSNNDVLLKFLKEIKDNMATSRLIIGMFDRDSKLEVAQENGSIDIRDKEYLKLSNNVYAFAIPVPHNRSESNQISIEHYFTDTEIKTEKDGKRLFLGNEFYKTGAYKGDADFFYNAAANVCDSIRIIEHETKRYVTNKDGSADYSISKAAFVKCIENNEDQFSTLSFDEFNKIFDIISKIVIDSHSTTEEVETT